MKLLIFCTFVYKYFCNIQEEIILRQKGKKKREMKYKKNFPVMRRKRLKYNIIFFLKRADSKTHSYKG